MKAVNFGARGKGEVLKNTYRLSLLQFFFKPSLGEEGLFKTIIFRFPPPKKTKTKNYNNN